MVAAKQPGRDCQSASQLDRHRARAGPAAAAERNAEPGPEADCAAAEQHEPGDHQPRIACVVRSEAADLG